MAKVKIVLPTVLTEDTKFYEGNEDVLKEHLGKPYISYSSVNSWFDKNYRADFIKQKFLGIDVPGGPYADFGSWVGESIEKGEWLPTDEFGGQENLDVSDRVEGAEYERLIVIDMGEYIIVGFIDVYIPNDEEGDVVIDVKTGGKGKEDKYLGDDYIQVPLYCTALEREGRSINYPAIWYIERVSYHRKPPMTVGPYQEIFPLEWNEEKSKYALEQVDKAVREISDCYKTYLKVTQ